MKKKFAIHPGYRYSRLIQPDYIHVEKTYVDFMDLVNLYDIDIRNCVRWDDNDPMTFAGRIFENYIHLYPLHPDKYEKRS